MAKQSKDQQPYWRPDFSDHTRLPDIKVVRTNFMINFVVVIAALMALFVIGQREYSAFTLRSAIADMESQIQAAEAEDQKNLQLSLKFIKTSQDVLELERFYSSPVSANEVLIELSTLRPEGLFFNNVTISEVQKKKGKRIYLEYEIALTAEVEDPVLLSDFKQAIQESEIIEFEGMSKSIEESLQPRNFKTGIFPCRIIISIQPGGSSKGGAKA